MHVRVHMCVRAHIHTQILELDDQENFPYEQYRPIDLLLVLLD